jgi:hypothetical protein
VLGHPLREPRSHDHHVGIHAADPRREGQRRTPLPNRGHIRGRRSGSLRGDVRRFHRACGS